MTEPHNFLSPITKIIEATYNYTRQVGYKPRAQKQWIPYALVTVMVALLTIVFWKIGYAFTLVNLALLYLLPVLLSAIWWGLASSFYAAGIGVVAFDFFFVPPIHTFTVSDFRYFISFAVYLAVATFTASLASQLRQRAQESKEREMVTSALYTLSTQIAAARDLETVLVDIVRHARYTFGFEAAILLPDAQGNLQEGARVGFEGMRQDDAIEVDTAHWCYQNERMAGNGTSSHTHSAATYVPLKTESTIHGVLCIKADAQNVPTMPPNQMRVIQALASLAAISVARIHFEEEAKLAHLTAESERLRTALLDSISHELRTPLATIIGATTGMLDSMQLLTVDDKRELLLTVKDGAMRMNRLVTNLLGMVRLESGMLRLNKHWCDVTDIIGVAIRQVQDTLQERHIAVHLQPNLPAISVDDVLMEQVLVNLLSNAIKYSPKGSEIDIDVREYDGIMTMKVSDEGVGITPEDAERIFEKFYRSNPTGGIPGTGLGLPICKGIVDAHDGHIFARPKNGVGTVVTILLPIGNDRDALELV